MKVLVANLGSTSFKYRLFDMATEQQLARGGTERIGGAESRSFVEINGQRQERTSPVPDHAVAVRCCLEQLTDPARGCIRSADEVAAIGFKAVHGGTFDGVQRVTPQVLAAMETMNDVAPSHNPPYIKAMRILAEKLPEIPLVAAFETGFHATIPEKNRHYGVPYEWASEYGIRRWGFHGASHRFISERISQLMGRNDLRVISCHLGGSSSLSAIQNGKSVANSLGMSPQTGILHNNRVGDCDPYALPIVMRKSGKSLEQILKDLASNSGLLGLSGTSGDVRDLEQAADGGNGRARLALDVFITAIRHYLGAYLLELGGLDALIFTGGIGENGIRVRSAVCSGLAPFGLQLDEAKNQIAKGESLISAAASPAKIWVIPTNEELVVARQTRDLLKAGG